MDWRLSFAGRGAVKRVPAGDTASERSTSNSAPSSQKRSTQGRFIVVKPLPIWPPEAALQLSAGPTGLASGEALKGAAQTAGRRQARPLLIDSVDVKADRK